MGQLAISSSRQPSQPSSNQVTGTYKPKSAEFTMIDFEEYQKDNVVWFSPHFYTHPNEYLCQWQLRDGEGSYTHCCDCVSDARRV